MKPGPWNGTQHPVPHEKNRYRVPSMMYVSRYFSRCCRIGYQTFRPSHADMNMMMAQNINCL